MYSTTRDHVGRSAGSEGVGVGYPDVEGGTISSGFDSQLGTVGWQVLVNSAEEEALVTAPRSPPLGGTTLCDIL